MKRAENLDRFVQNVIKYLGSGYKYYKVVRIPARKRSKTAQICQKIENRYQTSISRGKRQYRRKKGLANYGAVNFRDIVIVFRTEGENQDKLGEFKTFKQSITIEISEFLTLVFFINERKRLTVRLDRLTYRRIREDFFLAIKNGSGYRYNKLKSMWLNLPRYKGIGVQGSNLHSFIKDKLKTYNRTWAPLYGNS